MLSYTITARLLAEKPAPGFLRSRCLNSRNSCYYCRNCSAACPAGAIRLDGKLPKIDKTLCQRCGTCAASCPAAALSLKGVHWERVYACAAVMEKPVLGCSASRAVVPVKIPCAGGLSGDFFAALAVGRRFRPFAIDLTNCHQCRSPVPLQQILRSLQRGKAFTGKELPVRLLLPGETAIAEEETLFRRELFVHIKRRLQGLALEIAATLPELMDKEVSIQRLLLREAVARGKPSHFYLPSWEVDERCSACGRCRGFCPQGAWLLQKDDHKEGKLIHFPWRCTACALCSFGCPEKALTQTWAAAGPGTGQARVLRRFARGPCSSCSRPTVYPAAGGSHLCLQCRRRQSLRGDLLRCG